MIEVNLNPRRKKKPSVSLPNLPDIKSSLPVIIPIVVLGVIVLPYTYLNTQVNNLQEKKNELTAEKERLKLAENRINQLKKILIEREKEKSSFELKFKTLQYLADAKKSMLPKLNSITLPVPNGLWLESVEISQNSAKITGNALHPELIARYYQNLSILYKNISFDKTEKKVSPVNVDYYNFTIEIKD
jgi:type IV pilus assembly protein PilN